jgi:DNA mismatch endonuclease, patch repair protein
VLYIRDGRAPVPIKKITSKIMSSIKSKNTIPERLLRKAIWKRNIRGYRLHDKGLPGRPDIAFQKIRVAVFINGCFWHRCPYCNPAMPKTHKEFWLNKFKANVKRDKKKTLELERAGWKALVFWECEIRKNVEKCATRLGRVVCNQRSKRNG